MKKPKNKRVIIVVAAVCLSILIFNTLRHTERDKYLELMKTASELMQSGLPIMVEEGVFLTAQSVSGHTSKSSTEYSMISPEDVTDDFMKEVTTALKTSTCAEKRAAMALGIDFETTLYNSSKEKFLTVTTTWDDCKNIDEGEK